MYRSRIKGCGHFLPERVIKNIDLLEFMETSDEWIQERTGIEERRWIDPLSGENTSTMGAKAAERAMKAAGVSKEEIDFIIFATLSPDMYFPGGGGEGSRYPWHAYHRSIGRSQSMFGLCLCPVSSRSIHQDRDVSKYFGNWQ